MLKEININTGQEIVYDKATYQDYKCWLKQIRESGFLGEQEIRGIFYELIDGK